MQARDRTSVFNTDAGPAVAEDVCSLTEVLRSARPLEAGGRQGPRRMCAATWPFHQRPGRQAEVEPGRKFGRRKGRVARPRMRGPSAASPAAVKLEAPSCPRRNVPSTSCLGSSRSWPPRPLWPPTCKWPLLEAPYHPECVWHWPSACFVTPPAPPGRSSVSPWLRRALEPRLVLPPVCRASERSPHPPRLGLMAHEPPMSLTPFGYFSNLGIKGTLLLSQS